MSKSESLFIGHHAGTLSILAKFAREYQVTALSGAFVVVCAPSRDTAKILGSRRLHVRTADVTARAV